MELETLQDLYIHGLKDLYSAENQILKALPKMIKASSHQELKRAFRAHLQQTREQVRRLERICKDLGVSPRGVKCEGMEGLVKEAKGLIQDRPDKDVLDAGLISAAQHVEHYEMAGYGTLRTYAKQMGLKQHQRLLQTTLNEEGGADKKLTVIAERRINIEAEIAD